LWEFWGKNIREFETHVFGNSRANGCYNILSGEYVGIIIYLWDVVSSLFES
jgi:hypothetical protein